MAVDDATSALLVQLAEAGGPPIHQMPVPQARGVFAALADLVSPGPDLHAVREDTVRADDGYKIPVRVYSATEQPHGVIVYFHGGGWVLGSVAQYDAGVRRLAAVTNCVVVSADYRLAPEYPYPTAARDAWDVVNWTSASWPTLPLIVAGDSAGGNLAAVAGQRAAAESGPPIALQVLIYPIINHDLNSVSYLDPANQLLLDRDSMIWFWNHYTPDPAARRNPDASPLWGNLAGSPPALVLIPEYDVLRDEGEAYADALARAGVAVQINIFDGQMHGFFQFPGVLPAADTALGLIAERIVAVTGG
ncbi:UNVERIFIED_CONTAM: acetyl esterase [Williamsia faeni]